MSVGLFLSHLTLTAPVQHFFAFSDMFFQRHLVWEAHLWLVVSLLELAVSSREAHVSSHTDTYNVQVARIVVSCTFS